MTGLSVVLCTYNGERFLGAELASIAAQSRLPDEMVVGDDRSTDGTAEIVGVFAASAPFPVRFLPSTERLGVSGNFQRAIAAATGDIIVLADQDDLWEPGKLARLVDAFADPRQPAMVFSDGRLVDEETRSVPGGCWERARLSGDEVRRIDEGDAFPTLLDRQLTVRGTVTGATMAFRATVRPLVLPFPVSLPASGKGPLLHDGWIALIASAAAPVRALPEQLVAYRLHGQQQIGLSAEPPPSRLRASVRTARSLFRSTATGAGKKEDLRWLTALQERLTALPPDRRAVVSAVLATRIAHYEVRANLPDGRLHRLKPVARELGTGRYGRYSSGVLSAVRDLLQA